MNHDSDIYLISKYSIVTSRKVPSGIIGSFTREKEHSLAAQIDQS
uniref:Uncharacterized protein n=1 Tax=Arundo donax TaxID=35708 RepID=A0A0A9B5N5_ARUDO